MVLLRPHLHLRDYSLSLMRNTEQSFLPTHHGRAENYGKTCLEQFVDFEYGLEDYISLYTHLLRC
jgi:hypothetical protein